MRCNLTESPSRTRAWLVLAALIAAGQVASQASQPTTVRYGRYPDCPVLQNDRVRVVFCTDVGGRILEYSLDGKNALFVSQHDMGDDNDRWRWDPSAGRFDIGPEMVIPKREETWKGPWQAEQTGPESLRLTSQESKTAGVRLVRDFQLDSDSTRLVCTQRIENVSDRIVRYCHWSRTLANGAGIVLVPLGDRSRFPNRYIRYEKDALLFKPTDPNVRIRDGFLEIIGPPTTSKLGMDSFAGWVAHQQRSGLMFIKQYPTYPDRPYNEVAAITLATWTPPSGETVELEPIGPAESIAPGCSASFTEVWWLLPSPFPTKGSTVDLGKLTETVESLPPTPWADE